MSERITRHGPHPVRLRLLEVRRVTALTPRMLRVTLTGDLEGFRSDSPDDHVKLFFPAAGEREPNLPQPSPNGLVQPEGTTPPARRDYTPRRYDPQANELDIDFVIHGDGPASTWAAHAQPGDRVGVGGPRGSVVVRYDFDGYLLIGDETALPSVARRLEELPEGVPAVVLLEVEDARDELPLSTRAAAQITWVHRSTGGSEALLRALRATALPQGEFFSWISGESATVRALKQHLLEERGVNREWVRASGYWKRGIAGHEEPKA
ncbi:NADPH-dependent ferric siderophore reductase [Deinobacterium chartae]|uniref:NADPH-dependent ferric siderophore reductase n=1 Tax=Deinobacterium chartae TaxID=521158 RepID=A0A841HVQ8_9DEIO|nr:siderophore-interacting protein [Deinobacterium chartae]MBB6097477.1 NADPH-dependent ferric siderophore reductase [Deinobacterium chartae]